MSLRMVGTVTLLLGVAVCVPELHAQGLRLGVKAGAARSDVAKIDGTENRWGLAGGAYLGVGLGSIIVQPEVLYVQRRARIPGLGAELADLNQNYVDVQLLVGFTFGILVKPILYLGPVASFETSCGISLAALSSECTDFDTKSAVFSAAVGAALDIGVFNLDVRYSLGLTDWQEGVEGKWDTLMIMGGLGLSLGL